MSKFGFLAVIGLAILISGPAYSRGGGFGGRGGGGGAHFGGGGAHFGGGMRGGGGMRFGGGGGRRFGGVARSGARPAFRGNRSFGVRNNVGRSANRAATFRPNANPTARQQRISNARSNAVRNVLNSRSVAGALHNRSALHNPAARSRIAASAAMAGWHGRGGGWWRHRNGGYGWVGPLFWPFAYYDIYDYALWGDGYDPGFWGYGYDDIYAGLFAPYSYDGLTGYLPQASSGAAPASTTSNPAPSQLAQMCGEDGRDIAGLPIDQIQTALQPDDAQRAALDDLANASVKAQQDIRAACPTQISLTAPDRLAAMQTRIEAMIAAVGTVQPPLDKFYGLLNDEQKARLNALGQAQRRGERRKKSPDNTSASAAPNCAATQPGVTDWPTAEIEAKLHPTDAQRASLTALQNAGGKAADMLKASCPAEAALLTPPSRLDATGKRLDVMLQAVKTVRTALDDFYGQLTDEQKAQFEAIGPGRTTSLGEPASTQARRRHHASIGGVIRRLISMAR
jgi:hypothetical protein